MSPKRFHLKLNISKAKQDANLKFSGKINKG